VELHRIPFDRALDFANKEKITELLYPLFVHNIGSLLCHPTNSSRATQVMAAAQQRQKQDGLRNGQSALPSIQQHHHHQLALPGPQPPLSSHPPAMGRPSLDRSHTFPTPPTSASSVMGSMGSSESFQWNQQGMSNGQAPGQISIDTTLSNNARSLPNTPATTPPGSTIQSMQNYPPVSQPYDNSRQMYQAPPSQHPTYPQSNPSQQDRPIYGQTNYVKNEMAPPSSRHAGPGGEQVDSKQPNGIMHAGQGDAGAPTQAEDEADHDHDPEYTHDSGAYDANRGSYNYSAPPVASLQNDHSHLSPDMSGSPHQAGSGRATPRTAAPPQPYYSQQGYNTPPRLGQPSSNLYNVMSNERGPSNGAAPSDVYASQTDMASSMQNGYATQQPVMNGSQSMKRGREDEDERPSSGGTMDKRRRTMMDGSGSMPSPTFNSQMAPPAPAITTQRRR
jgi:protein SOK2